MKYGRVGEDRDDGGLRKVSLVSSLSTTDGDGPRFTRHDLIHLDVHVPQRSRPSHYHAIAYCLCGFQIYPHLNEDASHHLDFKRSGTRSRQTSNPNPNRLKDSTQRSAHHRTQQETHVQRLAVALWCVIISFRSYEALISVASGILD